MSPNCKKMWFVIHNSCGYLSSYYSNRLADSRTFPKNSNSKAQLQPFCCTQLFLGKSSSYHWHLTVRMKWWKVFMYLWCRYGRAQWADARRGWSVWTVAGCAHEVWHCLRSPRTGWRDYAPPPWTGLSLNLSPHLGKKGKKKSRKGKLKFVSFHLDECT